MSLTTEEIALERKKLVAFLTKYDAAKVGLADELLKKFVAEGKPGITKMWQSLIKRYNVQAPGAGQPAAAAVASPLGPAGGAAAASPKAASPKTPAAKKAAAAPAASPKKDASPKRSAPAETEAPAPTKKPSTKKAAAAPTSSEPSPAPAGDNNKASVAEDQRARLQRYFSKHMPDKMGQIDSIVAKMSSTDKNGEAWANMWKAFTSRFGPEDSPPSASLASPPAAAQKQSNAPKRQQEQQPRDNAPSDTSSVASERAAIPSQKFAGLSRPKLKQKVPSNDPSESGVTSSSAFSPARVDNDFAGEGSMTSRSRDAASRVETSEALRQEWVQRISRYLSHYDAPKTDEEILVAVKGADASPTGMQEMWETLLEHYGPEPPQPLSKLMRVMDAEHKRKTPQQAAQSLIFGDLSSTAKPSSLPTASGAVDRSALHATAPLKQQQHIAGGDSAPVGAAMPLSAATSGGAAANKKKAWYLDDDDTSPRGGRSAAGGGRPLNSTVFREAAQSGNLAFHDGNTNGNDDVNRVPANALVIYGVLRLIGVQFDLYARATGPAQHQFVRAIEQEISFNIDCDPSAVVVRRVIPNVAIDFKIDLSAAVDSGTKDRRTAQRIGDILVNRVLNGTFTLRLVRDSYRRDLGGIATDVFTQSCAVFGSEAQQYYTLVPDDQDGSGGPSGVAPGYPSAPDSRNYAAVAAAPASRTMHRHDVFGTSPSPHRQHQSTSQPRVSGAPAGHPQDASIEQWTDKLHHIAEQDRAGLGGWQGSDEFTARWLAGVRPPPAGHDPSLRPTGSAPLAGQLGGGGYGVVGGGRGGGDFGTRVWDDTASELPDYQRREETSQYDLQRPEMINSAMSWNRILNGFEDPATAMARKQQGLQHVSYNPRLHTGMVGAAQDYSPLPRGGPPLPSQMDLKGLQRLRTVGTKAGGTFGGGSRQQSSSPRGQSPNYRKYEQGGSTSPIRMRNPLGGVVRDRSPLTGRSPLRATGSQGPSRRVVSGPSSLVEPPVGSGAYHESQSNGYAYKGFGHSNPAIRSQVEQRLDMYHPAAHHGGSGGGYAGGGGVYEETYMEREGRRARQGIGSRSPGASSRMVEPTSSRYGGAHSSNQNAWPVDGFSREFNNIVRSL